MSSEAEFTRELETLVVSRCFVTVIQTFEESRALSILSKLCEKKLKQRPLISWDSAEGFAVVSPSSFEFEGNAKVHDTLAALNVIDKYGDYRGPDGKDIANKKTDGDFKAVFVMKDLHEYWEDHPQVKRKLRNMSQTMFPIAKAVFVISPYRKIPDDLKSDVVVVDLPMPREKELIEVLDGLEQKAKGMKVDLDKDQREKLIQAALGLTGIQAQRAFRKAAARNGGILTEAQIKSITEEKRQVIRQSEALEYFPGDEKLADIGGLEVLKDWLQVRQGTFGEEARKYQLPPPKGVLLIGVPGTGKSLTAKAVGSIWKLPVLRLDTGALFGGLVGESEERTRRALDVANTVSPCVLWIDEVEKAFATQDLDGGTSARVFGSILTWMQEKTSPVFVVATANNVEKLPPELLRKGRFDEIFFLDLPTEEERKEIFSVQLKKRGWKSKNYDLDLLAKESEFFVGAEIEEAVKGAMYRGFNDNRRAITDEDILFSLKKMRPLAESHKEFVNRLRSWVTEGRLLSASFRTKKEVNKAPDLSLFEDRMEVIQSEGEDN